MNPLERVAGWDDDSGQDRSAPPTERSATGRFDFEEFILRHDITVRKRSDWNGGEKLELEVCPLNPGHIGGCAAIILGGNGSIGFKCHHNSCAGIGWKELRERLEPSYRGASSAMSGNAFCAVQEQWPDIVPFATGPVERIPPGLLPGAVGDMARAVACATETPIELPLMTGLGIVAASIAGKIDVCLSPDHIEPTQIFTTTALPSGSRKTAVLTAMAAPFVAEEARLVKEITPEYKRLLSERKTLEGIVERLRKRAIVEKNPSALIKEIAQKEAELPEVPSLPRLWTQDVTPEHLGTMMADNGGRMAAISDEGGIFDILNGRYTKSGGPNLDLFLQGHSGSPVRVDRGSRPPVMINAPALTLVLTPQPDVLRSLSEQKAFRGRGLLARFFFTLPPSPIGSRKHDTSPVSPATRDDYRRCISSLLAFAPPTPGGRPLPLRFSRDALIKWKEFQLVVESMMAEYGILRHLQDWGSKLPGGIARIAAGIHCSLHARNSLPTEIQCESLDVALALGGPLISHAIAVFGMMQKPEKIEHAEKLLSWIVRNNKPEFSLREMFRAHQSRFQEIATIMEPVRLLQEHGYIRPTPTGKKIGRPRDIYQVNPDFFEKNPRRDTS